MAVTASRWGTDRNEDSISLRHRLLHSDAEI